MFDVRDKVAIVTGGLGGIGLAIVKEFLKHGLRGVTIVDINDAKKKEVLKNLEQEFGPNKAIFIQADVSNFEAFENVFKETLSQFKNVDILSNNAAIVDELNWQRMVAVNLNGVINGTLLAAEKYILNHRTGEEGVILNTASVGGLQLYPIVPMYAATKFGIVGLTGCMGLDVHYNRTKIKVIAICPGKTETEIIRNITKVRPYCEDIVDMYLDELKAQTPEAVAENALNIVKKAKSGTFWVIENGKSYEYVLPDREVFANN